MLILVKTDNNVDGSAERSAEIEAQLEDSLSRFAERITRVEVKFFDDNSRQKGGADDMRCVLECRLAGRDPIMIAHQAPLQREALDGAVDKLIKTLDRTLGRLNEHKGRMSYGGDQTI